MSYREASWRTKAAASLLKKTGAKNMDDAIQLLVMSLRQSAIASGFQLGTMRPPYDPKPMAVLLGVSDVRDTEICHDGRIIEEGGKYVIELGKWAASRVRKRFTIAHEVGHLAIWSALGKAQRMGVNRQSKHSEIERLCDMIAAEVLLPKKDLLANRGSCVGTPDFVMTIASNFDVSLNFAAIRIKELLDPRLRSALYHADDRRIEWSIGVADKAALKASLQDIDLREAMEGQSGYVDRGIWCRYGWKKIAYQVVLLGANG